VPANFFAVLSHEMMLRPVQIRANAEDAAFMIAAASASSARFKELELPVTVIGGAADRVVDVEAHSRRLHPDVPQSKFVVAPGPGHHRRRQDRASELGAVALPDSRESFPPTSLLGKPATARIWSSAA
jgi:hypothetical protein